MDGDELGQQEERQWATAMMLSLFSAMEKRQFSYPLEITVRAADGQQVIYKLPAKGAEPVGANPGPTLRPPYTISIHESYRGGRRLRVRVTGKLVAGVLQLSVFDVVQGRSR